MIDKSFNGKSRSHISLAKRRRKERVDMKMQKNMSVCLVCLLFLLTTGCQAVQKQAESPETVVAEGKNECEFFFFTELDPGMYNYDTELGVVTRGQIIKANFDCGTPYLDGVLVGINDYWFVDGQHHGTGWDELLTVEGGVWKGTSENPDGVTIHHVYLGEGKYKDLKLTFVFDATTSTADYHVTKVNQE
jgi:hypothetical protein